MFPDKSDLSIVIPAKTELLKMVVETTRHVAAVNRFSLQEAQKIALAVDEAITNVIKHSYGYQANAGDIKIEYFVADNGIKILVSFSGIPPILRESGIDLSKMIKAKRKSGLGVELMRRIMDSVVYSTVDSINYCEMIKWKH
jgi:serine/threonine-protein kinase RsbW